MVTASKKVEPGLVKSDSGQGLPILIGAVAAAGLAFGIYKLSGGGGPPPPPTGKGTIKFRSTPVESNVFLNDAQVGVTPLDLQEDPGTYTYKMTMITNPGIFKTGTVVLQSKEIKTITADYTVPDNLTFELEQPVVAPADNIYQGTTVAVICPVKNTSTVATIVKGVIEIHYGSILPGTGALIKSIAVPAFNIAAGATHDMTGSFVEVAPADGRRDIVVKVLKSTDNSEIASHQFDDAYTVKANPLATLQKIAVSYPGTATIGQPIAVTVTVKNTGTIPGSYSFRADLKNTNRALATWQEGQVLGVNLAAGAQQTVSLPTIAVPGDWANGDKLQVQIVLIGQSGAWDTSGLITLGVVVQTILYVSLSPNMYQGAPTNVLIGGVPFASGEYTAAQIAPGYYAWSFAAPGYVTQTGDITIVAGQPKSLTIALVPVTVQAEVSAYYSTQDKRVYFNFLHGPANTPIYVLVYGGGGINVNTDALGSYAGSFTDNDPPGDYELRVANWNTGVLLAQTTFNIPAPPPPPLAELAAYYSTDLGRVFWNFLNGPPNTPIYVFVYGGGGFYTMTDGLGSQSGDFADTDPPGSYELRVANESTGVLLAKASFVIS